MNLLCLVVYPEGERSVDWQKAPLIGTIDWMRPAEYALRVVSPQQIYKKDPSRQLHSSIGSYKNWVSFAAVLHHVEERLPCRVWARLACCCYCSADVNDQFYASNIGRDAQTDTLHATVSGVIHNMRCWLFVYQNFISMCNENIRIYPVK